MDIVVKNRPDWPLDWTVDDEGGRELEGGGSGGGGGRSAFFASRDALLISGLEGND